MQPSYILFAA